MTELYVNFIKIWIVMTDKVDSFFEYMTNKFHRSPKPVQKLIVFSWVWAVFFALPFIVTFVIWREGLGFKVYFRALVRAYKTQFWEFRYSTYNDYKKYCKVNTKLHRALE